MDLLTNRVAIVTGAGRGLGRQHALLLAEHGVKVVVNDIGTSTDGSGEDGAPAQQVVEEIRGTGGTAISNLDNVADWAGAERVVQAALDAFGELHILINNAGIVRDKVVFNMTEREFDEVVAVHLKGHFACTHFASIYWRERHKADLDLQPRVVNTSSPAGLYGSSGQTNYAVAKAGIAAMTIANALELERYGVKVNCIAPVARTRMTLATPKAERYSKPEDGTFDEWDPANISPLVAFLASSQCQFNGQVFQARGSKVGLMDGWKLLQVVDHSTRWSVDALAKALSTWPPSPERRIGKWPDPDPLGT